MHIYIFVITRPNRLQRLQGSHRIVTCDHILRCYRRHRRTDIYIYIDTQVFDPTSLTVDIFICVIHKRIKKNCKIQICPIQTEISRATKIGRICHCVVWYREAQTRSSEI